MLSDGGMASRAFRSSGFTVLKFSVTRVVLAPLVSLVLFYPVLVSAMRPHRGRDPNHDAAYIAVALAIAGLVVGLRGDVLAPLLAALV